ncbi:MAG: hypothetical protein M1826_005587 [Phylliscum demangeonii]|nr:MAG: hypothetical protein M1826_005587 [Phylliscum demangeonii]
MSSTHGKRRTSSDVASSDRPQIKRRKASSKVPRPDLLASRQGIEEVDLCGDDDEEAAELLRKQREDQIKEQEKNSPKARKLTNLQCIICFEPPTDMTVTACATIKRGRKQTDYIPLELKLASRKRLPEGVAVE